MKSKVEDATIVGVAVAACAVCCAGPILGLLAAIGGSALLGTLLFGVVGAIAVAAVGLMLVGRLRRNRAACAVPTTVSLEAPSVGVGRASVGPHSESTDRAVIASRSRAA